MLRPCIKLILQRIVLGLEHIKGSLAIGKRNPYGTSGGVEKYFHVIPRFSGVMMESYC